MAGGNHLLIAKESAYGTPPATGWRGVAVEDLGGHKPDVAIQQPDVMVLGQQGPSTRGRQATERTWTGTIKTYLASSGLGILSELVFGAPVVTVLEADEAYQYVFQTSAAMSATSIAAQVAREFKGAGLDRDTLAGGQAAEMRVTQAVMATGGGTSDAGLAKVEYDINYQRREPGFAAKTPVYNDPELYYSGGRHTLQIGPTLADLEDECLNNLVLKIPTGADFEDPCISTTNRDKAVRGGLPMPTIEAGYSYKGRTYFDAYLEGALLAMRSKWEGTVEISDGILPSVTFDIAAYGLTGDAPEESKDSTTKQNLPASVLWNETDPMVKMTVISSDATL